MYREWGLCSALGESHQRIEDCLVHRGGYHQSIEGLSWFVWGISSVHCRDIMVGVRDIMSALGVFHSNTDISQCTHDSLPMH